MRLLVLYSGDLSPRSQIAPGGINGNIRAYLGALPPDWDIEVWGASERSESSATGSVHAVSLGQREVRLRPLVQAGPVAERTVPLSPRYAAALMGQVWRGEMDASHWDVVIAHRAEFLAAACAVPGRQLPPTVIMLHSNSELAARTMGSLRGRALLLGERLAVPRCDAAVVVSAVALEYYRSRYSRYAERFHWIANGVDLARFGHSDRSAWRQCHGFDGASRLVVYHGRYDIEKGIGRMLNAFRLLVADNAPWHLLTAGVGPLAWQIAEAASTWGAGRIHDLGYLETSAIPALLEASDIGLLCSDFEGLSNGLLEGLAAGLPVVATDVGDNRIILAGVAPRLIAGSTASDLASAVRWAWTHRGPLRHTATAVAAEFSLSNRVRRLTRMFESLAAQRRFVEPVSA